MLQKVETASTFIKSENLLRDMVVIPANKQSQLATQQLLCDKLKENVARITWPLKGYDLAVFVLVSNVCV